jgi:hypothetical protein
MEDGTASVFGLVSGVALSANNGQVALLAGATGAATQQDQARALARQTEAQREAEDAALAQRVAGRLEAAGASTDQVAAFRGAIAGTPARLPRSAPRSSEPYGGGKPDGARAVDVHL